MLLCIDIGNTNVKFGLYDGSAWQGIWRAVTVPAKMGDEYAVLLGDFFHDAGLHFANVQSIVLASVVPTLTPAIVEMNERYMHRTPLIVRPGIKTGLRIRIENPHALGADRLVNVAAAQALFGGPAIVVDLGTATKWEVLTAGGDYLGGAIAPGVGLAPGALAMGAALLYRVEVAPPPSVIGKSSITAMQSGIFWGSIAMVEGLVGRIKAELRRRDPAHPDVRVIATGGLAPVLREHTEVIDEYVPFLTLEGLRVIWELNKESVTSNK